MFHQNIPLFEYIDDEETANRAAGQVEVTYSDQQQPILTIEDGIKAKSFFPNPGDVVTAGDADGRYKLEQKIMTEIYLFKQFFNKYQNLYMKT